jgi:hypothetical protein
MEPRSASSRFNAGFSSTYQIFVESIGREKEREREREREREKH